MHSLIQNPVNAWEKYYSQLATHIDKKLVIPSTTSVPSTWEDFYKQLSTSNKVLHDQPLGNTEEDGLRGYRGKRHCPPTQNPGASQSGNPIIGIGKGTNQNLQVGNPLVESPHYHYLKSVFYVEENKWTILYQENQDGKYYGFDNGSYKPGTHKKDDFTSS
ncbi:hypothetical protein [Bacillus cereus]|uniref:hypothetical protein n=1 Tax=Bacillus cereus TaxID=1396 RepID=UPI000279C967|nr:hypothetical protein [Bacillus cereus]EJR92472.1 hypothetical protein IKG_05636 [Bacillus cereus VD200]